MPNLLLTRHAILDSSLQVAGYTLECALTNPSTHANQQATPELLGALIDIGIDEIAGQHKLYIACSPHDAESLIEFCATSHRLGLYLQCWEGSPDESRDVARLCASHSISLAIGSRDAESTPAELLMNAEIAFLDAADISEDTARAWARRMKGYRARAGIEQIANDHEFQIAREAGCERFRGAFLHAPTQWAERELPVGMLSPLRLLSKLQDPDTTTDEIEQLVKTDAALSYRVLRWVNSSYYGLGIEIDHIGHAIVYLGLDQLRNLLSLLTLTRLRPASPELLTMSAIRARMAELLAPQFGVKPFRAFTLGLFSLVDAITNVPLQKVLANVSLHHDITAALMTGTGPYGPLLNLVINYEKGNWKALQTDDGPAGGLAEIYRDAVHWASSNGLASGH